jgi:hypothetical protein
MCGGQRCACRVLVGKPEGRRPHRRLRHRWEDDVKMDLKETEGEKNILMNDLHWMWLSG